MRRTKSGTSAFDACRAPDLPSVYLDLRNGAIKAVVDFRRLQDTGQAKLLVFSVELLMHPRPRPRWHFSPCFPYSSSSVGCRVGIRGDKETRLCTFSEERGREKDAKPCCFTCRK